MSSAPAKAATPGWPARRWLARGGWCLGAAAALLAVRASGVVPGTGARAPAAGALTAKWIRTRSDPGLHAVIDQLRPLRFSDGGAPAEDRPAHVRAASAVRRFGTGLLIAQDDANALVVHDAAGARALLLPAGPGGRRVFDEAIGNKRDKLDLEACAALPDGRWLVFGSGSTDQRERMVLVTRDRRTNVRDGAALYHQLRANVRFAGSQLNIEGALVRGDELLLFQRGNGAPRAGLTPVNAIGVFDLSELLAWLDRAGPVPRLRAVTQVELGTLGSARLGFTDAALVADGRVAVLACAESSADAVSDGALMGCRFGLLEGNQLRMTDVRDPRGAVALLKVEGLEPRLTHGSVFDAVVDMDDPNKPAQLGTLTVREQR